MSRAAIRCSSGQVTSLQTVSSGRKCPERMGRGPLEVELAGVLTKMWKHSGQLSPLLLFGCVTSPKFCLWVSTVKSNLSELSWGLNEISKYRGSGKVILFSSVFSQIVRSWDWSTLPRRGKKKHVLHLVATGSLRCSNDPFTELRFLLSFGDSRQMTQHLWRTASLRQGCTLNVDLAQDRVGEVVRWTDGQREKVFFPILLDSSDS